MSGPTFGSFIKLMKLPCTVTGSWVSPRDRAAAATGRRRPTGQRRLAVRLANCNRQDISGPARPSGVNESAATAARTAVARITAIDVTVAIVTVANFAPVRPTWPPCPACCRDHLDRSDSRNPMPFTSGSELRTPALGWLLEWQHCLS